MHTFNQSERAVYFQASDVSTGGLWRSDGTDAGTAMVKISILVRAADGRCTHEGLSGEALLAADMAVGKSLGERWHDHRHCAGKDIFPGSALPYLTGSLWRGYLFFAATDNRGCGL
jgi:hypothetical protein